MVVAIDASEARQILESPDLIAIGVRADDVRRQMHSGRTTFLRVFEIHVEAPPAALPSRLSAGEFRIVGRPSSLDVAVSAVRAAATLAGDVLVTGFSLSDLQELAGTSFATGCSRLHEAGLAGIAEVQVDRLDPESIGAVRQARSCGLLVDRLTVAEADPDRIAVTLRAREFQESVGGFRTFAPLPRTMSISTPSTGYDDVKGVAIARLLVTSVESIQVDWSLYGPKLAQVALTVGADDVDRVAAVDSGTLGARRSPIEEIKGNIRSAGLEPVERDARFEVLG
jgi:aminodeoxyfutalosine synthase